MQSHRFPLKPIMRFRAARSAAPIPHRGLSATTALLLALCCASSGGCAYWNARDFGDSVYRAQSPGESVTAADEEDSTLTLWWKKATSWYSPEPDEAAARTAYRKGDAQFSQKRYDGARVHYQEAAALAPNTALEEDSLFMIGECYFFEDRYPYAAEAYGELLKKYASSRHLDKASGRMYAIGRYWQELGRASPRAFLNPNLTDNSRPWFNTEGNAVAAYRAVWLNDPTGPLADDSVMQTANTFFMQGKYADADWHYAQLRKNHPTSKHVMNAYLLGYRTKLETYNGPEYDGTPLADAEELIEVLLTQFSDQLGDERPRVIEARAIVRAQQAEREWRRASFYMSHGYNQAAGRHLSNVIQKYPETRFAEMAREKAKEIADKPAAPPYYFAWLDQVLPQKKNLPKPIAPEALAP